MARKAEIQQLLTTKEVAAILRLHPNNVHLLVRAGVLQAGRANPQKPQSPYRFTPAAIAKYQRQCG